ncbi:MAG: hypothetical protein ABFR97_08470 [Thermodesulfobacteriota bacterium]
MEKIDVLGHPRKSLAAGVTMIPCLIANGTRLQGLFLGEKRLRAFLTAQASHQ